MSLRPGTFWPLVEIDLGVGIIGTLLAIAWGKISGRDTDRNTVIFLCKMFGGISLAFLIIIILVR
jgi:hypothetical protein